LRIEHMMCFQAVKRYRNFSEAADSLYISQSALSKQIRAFEDELGVELFDRKHTVIGLTSAGRRIDAYVNAILLEYDKMRLAARENYTGVSHKLRIASMLEMVQYGITDVLISYERKIANFHIESHECSHSQMLKLLESDQADIVIGYLEFLPRGVGYDIRTLRQDPVVLIANRSMQIAEQDAISLQDVNSESFCFPLEDEALHGFFCDCCTSHGFTPKLTMSDVRLGTIKRYVLAGMRCTLQMRPRAENFFTEPEFKIIEINDVPTLTLAMLFNEKKLDELGRNFIEFAVRHY
jgi:DNA-binding transcriptional LysR family regulator